MTPYRSPPAAPARAPHASWWRRFGSLFGFRKRLALHRVRHKALALYPHATWAERQETARLTWNLRRASGPMATANAEMLLAMHTASLGKCAMPGCGACWEIT